MMSKQRQSLAVFVDKAQQKQQHGMVTRSQARSQVQKAKQSTVSQPLQSLENLQLKEGTALGGKRKVRATAGKNVGEATVSKRRASRSMVAIENSENLSQHANVALNSQRVEFPEPDAKPSHVRLSSTRRGRRTSSTMVDNVGDQPCPMSIVKAEQSPASDTVSEPPCDVEHKDDELFFVPYVEEIYEYLLQRECLFRPVASYMDRQKDINSRMRSILINWVIEVHEKFRLRSSTLYLAVNLIDRYLSQRQMTRSKFQLLGCVALLLASKFEEIYPPEVADFVYIADQAYTREEMIEMESNVMCTLRWELSVVTPHSFANRYLQLSGATEWEQIYTFYLLELALVEYRLIKFKPSELAAAAVHLTLKLSPYRAGQSSEERWRSRAEIVARFSRWRSMVKYKPSELANLYGEYHETHTTYSRAMLKDCMLGLLDTIMNPNRKEKAVRKKYSKADRQAVSEIPVRELMKGSTVAVAAPSHSNSAQN